LLANAQDIELLHPARATDGRWGFINNRGELVIAAQYDHAESFSENRAVVELAGRRGYIDLQGQLIVPAQLLEAGPFAEGLALVTFADGQRAFLDSDGQRAFGLPAEASWATRFSHGFAAVQFDGDPSLWGFIDIRGQLAIAPRFSWAEPHAMELASVMLGGRAGLMGGGKWGYIGRDGELAIEATYDGAGAFSEGLAPVAIQGEWGYIDRQGRQVIPCQYLAAWPFSGGFGLVKESTAEGSRWGYIDRFGTAVIPTQYIAAQSFAEGLAAVKRGSLSEPWGFIDHRGETVIPPRFDHVAPFRGGLARVEIAGKIGYIDRSGRWIWEPR
jgi:hypothetical protein